MVKKAVCIGINYPGTTEELQGCVNDALRMYKCLVDRFGFAEKDIKVLIDTDDSYTKPTGKNIRQALSELVKSAKSGDVLFVHFSGHGVRLPLEIGEEDDTGFDECIVPSDINPIPDDDIRDIVEQVPEGCQMTFVSDSCHSGGLIDEAKEQIGESTKNEPDEEPEVHSSGFKFWNCWHSVLIKFLAFFGIGSWREEPAEIDTREIVGEGQGSDVGKSRYLPLDSFITLLKQQTGKENIETGKIRPTLYDVFGEESSPKMKKFMKVILTKLKEGNGQSGLLGKIEESSLEYIEHKLNDEDYIEPAMKTQMKSDREISGGGGSSNEKFPDRGILLSGCQTDETSADVKKKGEAYGAFSNAIQTVLSKAKEGKVTNKEMVLRAREILEKQGFTQRPGLYCHDRFVDAPFIC